MSLTKALIISALIFASGVGVQAIEINSPTYNYEITSWGFLYVPLYLIGIGFIPLYGIVKRIITKLKK